MEAPKLIYKFWVELERDDGQPGERVVWTRLSKTQAINMYRATARNLPDNVKRYGWSEIDRLAGL